MLLEFSKGKHIREASKLITEGKGDLEKLKNTRALNSSCGIDEVRKGVGVWTAELTMLRVMRRLEVLPDDDLGLRQIISRYYRDGRVIPSTEARRIGKTGKIRRV